MIINYVILERKEQIEHEKRLRKMLFNQSDTNIVPLPNMTSPVTVTFDADLIRVIEVVSSYQMSVRNE